jgi:two-component system cell cycle sensor histidine kinase/response regulator CckA
MSTILFVDDHHTFRTVFAEVLRTAGHTVLEAGTVADAEQVVERHSGPIDVLLVEAILTTANGLDVVRRVQPSHPKARLFFISEESAEDLSHEGLLPKGALFLRKPFDASHLMAGLQELLAAKKTRPKATRSRTRRTKIAPAKTASGSSGHAR